MKNYKINNLKKKYLKFLNCKENFKVNNINCEICNSKKNSIIINNISWGKKKYGFMPIAVCEVCGFVYQQFRFSKNFYENFYSKFYREKIFKNLNPTQSFILDQEDRGKKLYIFLKSNNLLKKKGSMADIGCSVGLFLKPFIKKGWKCFGNDPDKTYIEYGKKIFNLPLKCEQAEEMELKKNTLDLIIIMGSLEHCYDPNIVMNKCSIAAKKGSVLVLEARGYPQSESKKYFNHNHHRYFSKNTLELMMIKHGFEPMLTTGYPITGTTRKGAIYSIGVKKNKKINLKQLIKSGKRESVKSVTFKHKYYNQILKDNI